MVPVNGSGEPSISPTSPSQRHKGHFARDLALHPISGRAPDQWQCTRSEEVQCLRIGCSAPINKNKRGIDRSIDATTTSKLHEGRRRVELNLEISRHANPLLFGGCRATADPGCGTRGRRRGLAGQHTDTPTDWRPPRGLRGLAGLRADAPSEARGADGERAGRPRGGRRSVGGTSDNSRNYSPARRSTSCMMRPHAALTHATAATPRTRDRQGLTCRKSSKP